MPAHSLSELLAYICETPPKHSFWIGAKWSLEPRTPLFWLVSHPFWPVLPGGAELKLGRLHTCLGDLVPVSLNYENNLLSEAPGMPSQGSAVSLLGGKGSQWAFNVPHSFKVQCTTVYLSAIFHFFCNWAPATIVRAVWYSDKEATTWISTFFGMAIRCVLHTRSKDSNISPAFWSTLVVVWSNPYYPLITYLPLLYRWAHRMAVNKIAIYGQMLILMLQERPDWFTSDNVPLNVRLIFRGKYCLQ